MSYAIIIFLFFLFPFLLGNLWIGREEHNRFSKMYIYGYFTMFAVFEIPGVFFVHRGSHLSSLTMVWMIGVAGMTMVVLLFMLLRWKRLVIFYQQMFREAKTVAQRMRWMLCLLAFFAIFSVTMVIPSPTDATAEIVGISYNTDTMYLFAPYTQLAYADKIAVTLSPIEMLYAVGAYVANADTRVVVHLLLPCFLIPLYFAIGWRVSEALFGENLRKNGVFTALWGVFATIGMASVRNLSVGIYQNSWNGITLFCCCAVPLCFAESLIWWNKQWNRQLHFRDVCILGVIALGAQLLYYRAIMFAMIIFVVCGISVGLEKRIIKKESNVSNN